MDRLAARLASKIAQELSFSDEKRQVVEYGLIAILQSILIVTLVLLLGALFRIFMEAAILCFGVSILRKYSGGVHASTSLSCTMVTIIFCISGGLLMSLVSQTGILQLTLFIITLFVFIYAFIISFRNAPVDSPNKPIRTVLKKHKMKMYTIYILSSYFLISMILLYQSRSPFFISALLCLLLSVLWQISTLTKPGKIVLESVDHLIYKTFTKGGHYNEKN
ncbi:MAG: accessory gene regulator ArgB-like protein [Saccharofermentanales bacterium]